MRHSKKAIMWNIPIVVMILLVLVAAYAAIHNKTSSADHIGKQPQELLLQVQEGEKALIYLDYAAKYAMYQSLFDLQQQGGASSTSCGTYYGFNMWNDEEDVDCVPDQKESLKTFKKLYTSNIVSRISNYPKADFIGNIPGLSVQSYGSDSQNTK